MPAYKPGCIETDLSLSSLQSKQTAEFAPSMCTCPLCAVCPNVTHCCCIWQLDSLPPPSTPSVLCQPASTAGYPFLYPPCFFMKNMIQFVQVQG